MGLVRADQAGDHPVVYPGQGSHAAYYTQQNWFGKSAAAGFGCDNTTAPGSRSPRRSRSSPPAPRRRRARSRGCRYTGHWGQQEPSFNNGPTGPVTKTQWATPITWQVEEGRTSAVSLPPVPGPAPQGLLQRHREGVPAVHPGPEHPDPGGRRATGPARLDHRPVTPHRLAPRTVRRAGPAALGRPDRDRRVRLGPHGYLGAVAGISADPAGHGPVPDHPLLVLAPRQSGDITDVYGTTGRGLATAALLLLAILLVALAAGWRPASSAWSATMRRAVR